MDDQKKTIKEITALLKDLDLKDLEFLRDQAAVLDYNRKVRLENQKAQKESPAVKKSPSEKSKGGQKRSGEKKVRIEQTERAKFFNICIGNSRIFMDVKEIKSLYTIAAAAGSPDLAGPGLFRWIKKERSDILTEVFIPDGKSPVLLQLYQALMDNFTSKT